MKKILTVVLWGVLITLVFSCAGSRGKEAAFYISLSGNDSWSGKLAVPNSDRTDGPFRSFKKARDAVRELKQIDSVPNRSVSVTIRGGIYPISETLTLTSDDSGSVDAPVVWRNYPGEEVHFTGGKVLSGFSSVSDSEVLKRIDKRYHDKIVRADLRTLGIADFGTINPASGRRIELFFKNKFMTIARYPNEGWLKIADVPQIGSTMFNKGLDRDKSPVPKGRHYGRFTYDGSRPDRWTDLDAVWVHGYWTWDWSDQYLKVAKLDRKKREITPEEPHHGYGYTKNQRYYFLNILEELDSPGEWYLDITDGIVYFWPPSALSEGDISLSILEDAMISLEETSNITFQGIVFECSRGTAVRIKGGSNNTIAGCTFRNIGQTVVNITGGSENGVISCDIYDVAGGGIDLHGGDRKTLTAAGHYAVNNHIHDFGIRLKTYQPAVQTTGVGNRIAHNLIHDAPHCGIFLMTSRMGNEHIIEYNELHSLAKETGDVGAIYLCGRDFTMRGNIVRYNYLHHLKGPGLHGVMAIYLDDFTSGTYVYGNICYKASRAILLGGGRDNIFENNVFVECDPSIHVDARGLGWAKYYFENNNRFRDLMDAVNYTELPYSERYPELLTLQDDDPAVPKYNRIIRNVSYGGRWLDLYDGLDFSVVTVEYNLIGDNDLCRWLEKPGEDFHLYKKGDKKIMDILKSKGNIIIDNDPGFVDPDNEDFRLKDYSPAFKLGFKQIPVEKIGLYIDEYRTSLPQ